MVSLVCSTCPVQTECLLYAMNNREEFGYWGGLSGKQRKILRARALSLGWVPPVEERLCTRDAAGYSRHLYLGETPCDICSEAHARRRYRYKELVSA